MYKREIQITAYPKPSEENVLMGWEREVWLLIEWGLADVFGGLRCCGGRLGCRWGVEACL